ncbi:response regulator transcription factor [Ilyomonas limi]|uniref:Response regulator transcription factor n=1 Tax=Ilyomonas limi TaxID=2575867 RepID=A0A4U3KY57_9BACT|nr:LytTR family DNA-binding domain-containing protein [Ilyomonas limi]TKK66674.1 response regulator transcription factor [Ilyomonas limi]
MNIKCIVVDDEPLAQKGLEEYIKEVPFLELTAICDNAAQAFPILNNKQADLMLLDIAMPVLSGIDFLKSLSEPPAVIFTTAYPQYALQGYELDVIDYLVKPISFVRFVKAVTKARDFLNEKGNRTTIIDSEKDFFFLKVNYQIEKIRYSDILFIEALQNYIAIHLADRKIVSYMTISNMEKQLPVSLFMRIHKSYIVALNKIDAISKNKVFIHNQHLPVSRTTKEKLIHAVANKLVKRV